MSVTKILIAVLVVAVMAGAGAYYLARQEPGPVLQLRQPGATIGRQLTFELTVTSPGGRIKRLEAVLEQSGRSIPLVSYAAPGDATITQETPDRARIVRKMAGAPLAGLRDGPARIEIVATRQVFFGLREAETRVRYELKVRVKPPTISVVSKGHRLILGGAEAIVYRVTPPDVDSGVQVGDVYYPGYAASGAGVKGDPSLKVAFFALLFDQDATTPMRLVAKDVAGNTATASFDHKVVVKRISRSRVKIDDGFLARVVPAVLKDTPGLSLPSATTAERLNAFVTMNSELRRKNAEAIEKAAAASAPDMLWSGAFKRLGRTKTESAFADHRTYLYNGREVDQQVHLGFDLASTKAMPVAAANAGKVLFAGPLGIYGNTVIIDHGMGLQSLYAHLSAIEVEVGDRVVKGEKVGKSGRTGFAAGDHVHFTMLVAGRPVTPVEWWDQHWINDRILRKFTEAQGGGKE
jgi:murein DD-endopeptidase MepM/ murein hydrolase activator NlpD